MVGDKSIAQVKPLKNIVVQVGASKQVRKER